MHKARVFLIRSDSDGLIPLEDAGYIKEVDLQDLLAKYPDIIPGEQIDPEHPRRWLLVAREMGVPGDEGESGRWSLDHLFLDQDGILTFVECKRASDTRIRREVVAQMLDYAANGVEYWDTERIRQSAAETAQNIGKSLDEEITKLIGIEGEETSVEDYWDSVTARLKDHRIRLIFVSDTAPRELRRLVEFLNEEMQNVEVLAVEVRRFASPETPGHEVLVPRVIGATEAARSTKATRKHPTTPGEFLAKCTPEAQSFFNMVIEKALERGHTIYWGEVGFSVRAPLGGDGGLATFVFGYPPDKFQFYFAGGRVSRDPASPLRAELEAMGVFSASGEYTMTAYVSGVGQETLSQVYMTVLERVDTLLKG